MYRSAIFAIVAAACLAAGVAIGWGASRHRVALADPSGVLHGCYVLHGADAGRVRLLPAPDACPRGESEISWSVTGPQGATGQQGPTGAQGATGPRGAAGATKVTVRSSSSSDTVTCNSGEVAVGGGGGYKPSSGVQYLKWSHPVESSGTPTGWTASPSPVYVICASP